MICNEYRSNQPKVQRHTQIKLINTVPFDSETYEIHRLLDVCSSPIRVPQWLEGALNRQQSKCIGEFIPGLRVTQTNAIGENQITTQKSGPETLIIQVRYLSLPLPCS